MCKEGHESACSAQSDRNPAPPTDGVVTLDVVGGGPRKTPREAEKVRAVPVASSAREVGWSARSSWLPFQELRGQPMRLRVETVEIVGLAQCHRPFPFEGYRLSP